MKISQIILACVLIGMVGCVFAAAPIRVICKYDTGETMREVEFDDDYTDRITIEGKTVYKEFSTQVGKREDQLRYFSKSSIEWDSNSKHSVYRYSIDRTTGRITQERDFKGDNVLFRGTCTPVENKGF